MVRRSKRRLRSQRSLSPTQTLSPTRERSLPTHYSETTDPSLGALVQAEPMEDPGYDKPIGPSYYVPKEQYNLLKKHILGKRRKTTTKKKKTTTKRRRPYYRRYYGGGRSLSGMGPIVITGRGGYFTDKLRQGASAAYRSLQRLTPSGTFERLGQAAGGAMFGKTGASIGRYLGQGVSNIAGFGDYTISSNTLLDEGQQIPSFGDMNHAIIISHREYIQDISIPATPANFTLQSFPINPGLSQSFPWLSAIAPSFDQYEIMGMIFEFKSTSSDFGTTTSLAMGTVIMATDYDSADNNYASKIEMENAQYSTSCKPSVSCIHAIECDPRFNFSPVKYVRSGGVPSGKDIRLYDQGNFQIATVGLPTGSSGVIGELWVSYQIKFFKPQLTLGSAVQSASAAVTGTSSWDTSNYWGISPTLDPNNSLNLSISGNTATLNNAQVGAYLQITIIYDFGNQAIAAGLLMATTGFNGRKQAQSTVTTMSQYVFTIVGVLTSSTPTFTLSNLTNATNQVGVRSIWTYLDRDVFTSALP